MAHNITFKVDSGDVCKVGLALMEQAVRYKKHGKISEARDYYKLAVKSFRACEHVNLADYCAREVLACYTD
jgi:hypothetical protein